MLLEERQRELLRYIWRENRLSRWELHERTGVNPNAIGNEATRLLQLGIIREAAPESVGQGRPRTPLEIDSSTRQVLGVSLTANQVEIARMNLRGQLMGKPISHSADTFGEVIAVAQKLLRQNMREAVLGVGVSSPGFLDPARNAILFSSVTKDHTPIHIDGLIETCEKKPLVFENDMHALAVRWLLTHQAEETEDVVLVYIGDAHFGAAVLVDGKPNRGCLTGGNELGHTRLPVETDVCFCGHKGCLERICCTTYLRNHPANPTALANTTLVERAARCEENDEPLNDLIKYISMGLSNAVNFIRPNRLVLVSELTRYPAFSDKLLRSVRSALLFELVNHVRIDVWDQPGAISAESAGWLALAGLYQEGWNPL